MFEDGSVGWYEAGWGPMISDAAHFVKDIMTPNGSVSIVIDGNSRSDDIDSHTQTSSIKIHRGETDGNGKFRHGDEVLSMKDEPGHQELCNREQDFMLRAIRQDLDLSRHMEDAVRSLRICLAADESIRTGKALRLD